MALALRGKGPSIWDVGAQIGRWNAASNKGSRQHEAHSLRSWLVDNNVLDSWREMDESSNLHPVAIRM